MGQTEPNSQFFADFRWFLLIFAVPGNYITSRAQIFAENRRKPQIFAGNHRKPQIFAGNHRKPQIFAETFSSLIWGPNEVWTRSRAREFVFAWGSGSPSLFPKWAKSNQVWAPTPKSVLSWEDQQSLSWETGFLQGDVNSKGSWQQMSASTYVFLWFAVVLLPFLTRTCTDCVFLFVGGEPWFLD